MSKKGKKNELDGVEIAKEVSEQLSAAMLKLQVEELEQTKIKLLGNIKDLKEKISQLKEDQADIYYYLNKKCDDSYETIASLENQIVSEQLSRETAEKQFEKKIEELKSKSGNDEVRFSARIAELEDKILSLKEFAEKKEEMESNLARVTIALEAEKKQHKSAVTDLEMRSYSDREKLRREYDQQLEDIRLETESKIEDILSAKTKQTRQLNQHLEKELAFQSKHTDKVLEINSSTMEKSRGVSCELSLAKSIESEMMNKLSTYQRNVKQLNERVASDEIAMAKVKTESEELLRLKDEEIENLRGNFQKLQEQERGESQVDALWKVLSFSYNEIYTEEEMGSCNSSSGLLLKKSKDKSLKKKRTPKNREAMLIDLFTLVADRHPEKFGWIKGRLGDGDGEQRSARDNGPEPMFPPLLKFSDSSLASDESSSWIHNYSSVKERRPQTPSSSSSSIAIQTDICGASVRTARTGVLSQSEGTEGQVGKPFLWGSQNPPENSRRQSPGAGFVAASMCSDTLGGGSSVVSGVSNGTTYTIPQQPDKSNVKIRLQFTHRPISLASSSEISAKQGERQGKSSVQPSFLTNLTGKTPFFRSDDHERELDAENGDFILQGKAVSVKKKPDMRSPRSSCDASEVQSLNDFCDSVNSDSIAPSI